LILFLIYKLNCGFRVFFSFLSKGLYRTRRTISLKSLLVVLEIERTLRGNLFDNKRQGNPSQQVVQSSSSQSL